MLDIEEVLQAPEPEVLDASDVSALVVSGKALTLTNKTEEAMTALEVTLRGKTFDLSTTAGNKEARDARQRLVKLRTGLKKLRLSQNEEHQKIIDGNNEFAKSITTRIVALEEPIDAAIKADEERRAAEKAERERIERERILVITTKIEAIKGIPILLINETSEGVQAAIAQLEARPVELEEFDTFTGEAMSAKSKTLETLFDMHTKKVLAEQAAEVARQEQARLEEQRRQQAEVERQQREEQDRIAAEQKAVADAATKAAAEQLAQAQAILAEAKRVQAENERQAAEANRAEAERLQKIADDEARAKAEAEAASAVPEEVPADDAKISLVQKAPFTQAQPGYDAQAFAAASVGIAYPLNEGIPPALDDSPEDRPSDESIIRAVGDAFDVDAETAVAWIIEVGRNAEQANQLREAA